MINACLHLQRTGCQWRYLPSDFGPWETGEVLARPVPRGRVLVRPLVSAGPRRTLQAGPPGRAGDGHHGLPERDIGFPGRRAGGVGGHKKVKGIKRHILTCSLGFVLGVLVTPANVHDTAGAGVLLDRAAADGWKPGRVKVDGIYTGERMDAAADRHGLDVQVSTNPPGLKGFSPLARRGHLRNPHQPFPTPDAQPGAEPRGIRGRRDDRQLPPGAESVSPRRGKYNMVKQALRQPAAGSCRFPVPLSRTDQ